MSAQLPAKAFELYDTTPAQTFQFRSVKEACELDKTYEDEERKKPERERWVPNEGTRMITELVGRELGKTCFIVGMGPSKEKAAKFLTRDQLPEGCFTIALNKAVEIMRTHYWFFIDLMAYMHSGKHENAQRSDLTIVGSDRYWRHYHPDVYVYRRASTPEDVRNGMLVNWATSLLGAMHFAVWLGATRIVTVGCENKVSDHQDKQDFRLGELNVDRKRFMQIQTFTYYRVKEALKRYTKVWLPSWCSLADASTDGELPLPKTYLGIEKEDGHKRWLRFQHSKPTSSLNLTTPIAAS